MARRLIDLWDNAEDKIIQILKNEKQKPIPEQQAYDRMDFMILAYNYTEEEVRGGQAWRLGMSKVYHDITVILYKLITEGKVETIKSGRRIYHTWIAPIE